MILVTKSLVGSIALSLVVSACIVNAGADNEAMLIKSSQLTKLSAAVRKRLALLPRLCLFLARALWLCPYLRQLR